MDSVLTKAVNYLDHIDGLTNLFGICTENHLARWKYIGHCGMDCAVHMDPIVLKGITIKRWMTRGQAPSHLHRNSSRQ